MKIEPKVIVLALQQNGQQGRISQKVLARSQAQT